MKTLKIGDIKLKNRLFLSPMVDVTDLAYRIICRKAGAAIAYTEMLYVDAILHENERTKLLMKTSKEDHPVGLQITGKNEKEFERLSSYIKDFDLIDINCGCPSIKLINSQAGSYLLNSPEKISKMVRILKSEKVNPEAKPITAKIRLGFKENNVLKVAKMIENAGADAITLHARLAIHGRKIPADWKWIEKVKQNLEIPVIGNGDIFNGEDAEKMLEIADGAMIARGAIGDPMIFSRVLRYLNTGKESEFDFKKNLGLLKEYLSLAERYGIADINRIKYLGSNFIRNIQGAAKLRSELMSLKNLEEIKKFIKKVEVSE